MLQQTFICGAYANYFHFCICDVIDHATERCDVFGCISFDWTNMLLMLQDAATNINFILLQYLFYFTLRVWTALVELDVHWLLCLLWTWCVYVGSAVNSCWWWSSCGRLRCSSDMLHHSKMLSGRASMTRIQMRVCSLASMLQPQHILVETLLDRE